MGVLSRTVLKDKKSKSLPTIRANGLTFSLLAASVVISTRAAAPSFSVLALAAVTVPRKGTALFKQRGKCDIARVYPVHDFFFFYLRPLNIRSQQYGDSCCTELTKNELFF